MSFSGCRAGFARDMFRMCGREMNADLWIGDGLRLRERETERIVNESHFFFPSQYTWHDSIGCNILPNFFLNLGFSFLIRKFPNFDEEPLMNIRFHKKKFVIPRLAMIFNLFCEMLMR